MSKNPTPPTSPAARVGRMLNASWRVERLIDVGGMASVYEVRHRNGRPAAAKVLHAHCSGNAEVRRRFLREAYIANKIDHPGAVAILGDGIADDGAPFLVMELLEGESLAHWLQRGGGRLPFMEVLAIAGQMLEVLAVAHDGGIIHRDIKPGNVFVTKNGHAKLLDFGLARVRDGVMSLMPTLSGIVMGTAGYLAPEQARGLPEEVDARTDIFAVGAVMFKAAAGRPIHAKATPLDTVRAAMTEPAPSLGESLPAAPPAFVAAIDRAIAFDKAARWQSAREMGDALRGLYAALGRRPRFPSAGLAGLERAGQGARLEEAAPDEPPPSRVVDVAFGEKRDEAIRQERERMRAAIEALESISAVLEPNSVIEPSTAVESSPETPPRT